MWLDLSTKKMSSPTAIAFLVLLANSFPNVTTIVWDLDGTLGPMPGWDGEIDLNQYITRPIELRMLLNDLSVHRGIYHVLASRNGMLCDPHYDTTSRLFRNMGFHDVLGCYRKYRTSKVIEFAKPRKSVLLIDDNVQECIQAARDGAFAIHIRTMAIDAIPNNFYDIYFPVSG